MSRKAVGPPKDSLVYMRQQYGSNVGQLDENHLYKILSIGPKQCTMQRVNKENKLTEGRKFNIRLLDEKEALIRREALSQMYMGSMGYRELLPYRWDHILVLLGEEGWDPATNF